jgi:hypothetical protein
MWKIYVITLKLFAFLEIFLPLTKIILLNVSHKAFNVLYKEIFYSVSNQMKSDNSITYNLKDFLLAGFLNYLLLFSINPIYVLYTIIMNQIFSSKLYILLLIGCETLFSQKESVC